MPPKKVTKRVNSAVGDAGVTAGDGSPVTTGAAKSDSASVSASTRKSTRATTRKATSVTKRQTGVKASLATATEQQVSPASLSTTVVTPCDRENAGVSIQGGGESNVIRSSGSSVGEQANQGSGASQVVLGVGGDSAVPRNVSVQASCLAPAMSADKTASHVASAARSASNNESAVYPARTDSVHATCLASTMVADGTALPVVSAARSALHIESAVRSAQTEVSADCSAMTHAPVSTWPGAAMQHLSSPLPHGSCVLPYTESYMPPKTSVQQQMLTTNMFDSVSGSPT